MEKMKILVISYNGFSDSNANGKTLKNLLYVFDKESIAQFYCGEEKPDFDCCTHFFQVTDFAMCKSFLLKKGYRIINDCSSPELCLDNNNCDINKRKSSFVNWIKSHNYSYLLRGLREILWHISPWGKSVLFQWIEMISPDCLVYMVGDSWFLDDLAYEVSKRFGIPLILYNAEAYRLINVKERHGLDRIYNSIIIKSYKRILDISSGQVFNSSYLKNSYKSRFVELTNPTVCYNSSSFDFVEGNSVEHSITYFGNLGVGRVDTLIKVADAIEELHYDVCIDVYGRASSYDEVKLKKHSRIAYHGMVSPQDLISIKRTSLMLLHVESFDVDISKKLKYAFSTKIAQYLCAGKCVISVAPNKMASTQYLLENDCAYVIDDLKELKYKLNVILCNKDLQMRYASQSIEIAKKNHDVVRVSSAFKEYLDGVLNCEN